MTTSTAATTYALRVAGHLDDHWSATLGDLTLARRDDGTTTLTGPVVDQAQLHGILTRVRDLGAPLLSLRTVETVVAAANLAQTVRGTADVRSHSARCRDIGSMARPTGTVASAPPGLDVVQWIHLRDVAAVPGLSVPL